MSFLRKVRDYLEAQMALDGSAIKPKVFYMPEDFSEGVVLLPDLTGALIAHEMPGFRKGRFQVIVRAPNHISGEALADDMVRKLTMLNVEIHPTVLVNYIRARHDPIPYQKSKGGYFEFSTNFDFCAVLEQ